MSARWPFPLRVTDPSVFGRVAVLLGGDSKEREVSLLSGAGVLEALQSRGVDAFAVDGIPALISEINAGRVDRVFNILHGGDGENGVVQGLLQGLGVPYTGAGVLGAALTFDKIRTKQVWRSAGLPTPDFVRLDSFTHYPEGGIKHAIGRIGYPLFIKPTCEGSSVGIARVHSEADIEAAAAVMREYGGNMLAERLIEGDEITVGMLGRHPLPSIHIVPAGGLYDYHAKYVAEDTRYLCPAFDEATEKHLAVLVMLAFDATGCTGWGRVDLMRERASGQFWLLEINTAPGMTSHSLVPKAAAQLGIDYPELCWRILETTLEARA